MTTPGTFTQYSTIAPFLGNPPGWVDVAEQERIGSYQKYEEIYWSSEEGFTEVMRGDNEQPVFLPTARTLVNTVARYTCPDMTYTIAPNPLAAGSDVDAQIATLAFEDLMRREAFFSRLDINILYGLIRGDALWHVVADPLKPAGKRISLRTVDPASYFPVYDTEDPDRIVKVHLVELFTQNGQERVSRLTYEKLTDEASGKVTIMRSHGIFKTEKWWELTTPELVILADEPLPEEITTIPVYHWKNFDPSAPYGSSELRGLESVLAAINQAVSDEDLTLAMEGLGVWATDGAGPVDADGNETEWVMGPGRVLTKANGLRKLNGTTSLGPYGEHIDRLTQAAKESVGASDVAVGTADAATAESGIALLVRLGPILANTKKKDKAVLEVITQLLYDLCFWITVFEEIPLLAGAGAEARPKVVLTPQVGQKVPANQAEIIKRVVDLRSLVPPAISLRTAHSWLRTAGLEIPDNELQIMQAEAAGNFDPLAEPTAGDDTAADATVPSEEEAAV